VSNWYDPGTGDYIVVDNLLVQRDALRVAEAIKDYDPNLEILCVDPEKAELSEEPFIIAERGKDGILRPVLRAWVLDDLVLQRLAAADGYKVNTLKTLEQLEADTKAENQRRYNDIREETKDIVGHIAGMRSKYSVRDSRTGDLLTFYDDRPAKRS
jgi:hypothetical protein